jgi:hypothetical protein
MKLKTSFESGSGRKTLMQIKKEEKLLTIGIYILFVITVAAVMLILFVI